MARTRPDSPPIAPAVPPGDISAGKSTSEELAPIPSFVLVIMDEASRSNADEVAGLLRAKGFTVAVEAPEVFQDARSMVRAMRDAIQAHAGHYTVGISGIIPPSVEITAGSPVQEFGDFVAAALGVPVYRPVIGVGAYLTAWMPRSFLVCSAGAVQLAGALLAAWDATHPQLQPIEPTE